MRSYDIFDTILTRTSGEPRDTFAELGTALRAEGVISISAEEFARARQAAQDRAANRAENGEATLEEIYVELGVALKWNESTRNRCRDREVAVEGRHLRGVPARRDEINDARKSGHRISFLSDTQLPSADIRGWLEREGLALPHDDLFVSCEARASKRDGSLFRVAARVTKTDPLGWVHTGDNSVADVAAPRALGITAHETKLGQLSFREHQLRGHDRYVPPWQAKLAGTARLTRLDFKGDEASRRIIWETGAAVAAPLLLGFTAWLLKDAAERGIRRLYFVSRGGQIFHRLAQVVQSAVGANIECRYLYLSRRALAGLSELREGKLQEAIMAPNEVVLTLSRIRADFEMEIPREVVSDTRDAEERNLTMKERKVVAEWLLSPDRRDQFEATLVKRAESARDYFAQAGLPEEVACGFVDTGWAGTLQRSLGSFLSSSCLQAAPWYYLGLRGESELTSAKLACGYTNVFKRLPLSREPWLSALMELFARADHGSVRRLGPTPDFEPIALEEIQEVRLLQEAILCFATSYLQIEQPAICGTSEMAIKVISNFEEFASHPTREEALSWGRVPQRVHPADTDAEVLCPPMDFGAVAASLLGRRQRPPAWWLPGQASIGHRLLIKSWLELKRFKS